MYLEMKHSGALHVLNQKSFLLYIFVPSISYVDPEKMTI